MSKIRVLIADDHNTLKNLELWRRIIYYGCCFIAIIGAFYVDFSPVVIVDIYEPDKDTRRKARKYAESLLSEEDQKGLAQKRQAEIERDTITVDSNGWLEIYNHLNALKVGRSIPEEYKKRLPADAYPMLVFFFKPEDMPVKKIAHQLKSDNQIIYLQVVDENNNQQLQNKDISKTKKYLKLKYQVYSGDDFGFGGLKSYPRPPTWMLYPYRQYSLWLFLFGLAFYLALPVRHISPKALRYPRWRVILGDLSATILTFTFFALPFFIIGSAQQTLPPYILFSAVFWCISLIGVFTIKIALWYGSYQIEITDEGIRIADYRGIRHFRFNEMEHFQPVIFKPPKWLIWLTWLAALSGRGSAGRALLLSTSETGAIAIRLRDGREFYITVTDQMGSMALKGFEKIIESLKAKRVKELEDIKEIRSMGMEILR